MLALNDASPIPLSREEIEQVAGGASGPAPYNTPGNPDYGYVPYSNGNKPEPFNTELR